MSRIAAAVFGVDDEHPFAHARQYSGQQIALGPQLVQRGGQVQARRQQGGPQLDDQLGLPGPAGLDEGLVEQSRARVARALGDREILPTVVTAAAVLLVFARSPPQHVGSQQAVARMTNPAAARATPRSP